MIREVWARSASAVAVAVATARSRRTSRASLPISSPLKAAWRSSPSAVHSANSTRITSFGSTQRAPLSRGTGSRGESARSAPRAARAAHDGFARRSRCRPGRREPSGRHVRTATMSDPSSPTRSLPREPADDDHLLLAPQLDLEPAFDCADPGSYGERRSLATMPSSSCCRAASEKAHAVGLDVAGVPDHRVRAQARRGAGACAPRAARRAASAVEVEQVEDLVHDRRRLPMARPSPARGRSGCRCRSWSRLKLGRPCSSSATTSPSTIASSRVDPAGPPARELGEVAAASCRSRVHSRARPSRTTASTR